MSDWKSRYASSWARLVPEVLARTYPYAAQHVSANADDADVTPDRLHPSFNGCFDWHSSAHMQWSAVRLLTDAQEHLSEPEVGVLREVLAQRLSAEHIATEVDYLRVNPRFERPYGWAWVAMLAAACAQLSQEERDAIGVDLAATTRPLFEVTVDLVTDWVPKLAYPVRSGEHSNVAFGLSLIWDAAEALGDKGVHASIAEAARRWFADDVDYPTRYEPGGSDFLSPALCEADLMRRVLPAEEFVPWLAGFLPDLGAEGDRLLELPDVLDPTDGKAVHLYGLALSRAWQLRHLAAHLGIDRQQRIAEVTQRNIGQVQQHIVDGDFMSTHWLVSFALLAVQADGRTPQDG